MSSQPVWDLNLEGGCASLLLPLSHEDPAPPLSGSRELGAASEGIETRRLASCGRLIGLPAAWEDPGCSGPGAGTESVASRH